MSTTTRNRILKRLADQVLEGPDLEGLSHLLTQELPRALGLVGATLLLWDRKLNSFQALVEGETRIKSIEPGQESVSAPETRYLISEGELIETAGGKGEGALLPLMARSGLVGMLVLGGRKGRGRRGALTRTELKLLSGLAARAALALENHLYQRELIATERMAALGTMASMLAHDFRGPMTVIRGYAECLVETGVSDGEVRSRAELIMQMVDRLERMTAETLDFARGGGRLARRPVVLPDLLEEWATELMQQLPGLAIVRDLRVAPNTHGSLDVDKVRRAIVNIVANAHEAMGGRGRLHMVAHVVEEPRPGHGEDALRLVLVLRDEGPGVHPDVRERLFEPFVTRGKRGGTGLGLAISRRFIEDHGGTLELLPDGPGAAFQLSMPLERLAAPVVSAPANLAPPEGDAEVIQSKRGGSSSA
jgi:signal transduction histidine kinase